MKNASSWVAYGWPSVDPRMRPSASRRRLAPSRQTVSGEAANGWCGERAELHLPGAAPEGLVAVVEDRCKRAACCRGRRGPPPAGLEYRAHQVGQSRVEGDDLLELVEQQGDPLLALGCDPAGKLEQALDRVVDVAGRVGSARNEKLRSPSSGSSSIVGRIRSPRKRPAARSRTWSAARRGRRRSSSQGRLRDALWSECA